MRYLYALLTGFVLLFPATSEAGDIVADSKITAVTVFSDRARVTRTAEVEIPGGAHTVVFKDLPVILMPDSLRAEGVADADVKLGAVTHKTVSSAELVVPREQALTVQLQTLEDQMGMLIAEKSGIKAQRKFLEKINDKAAARASEDAAGLELNPGDWTEAAAAMRAEMTKTLKDSFQVDIKIRSLKNLIEKTEAELKELQTGMRKSYTVSVPLETERRTTLTLELSYQVPRAGWRPLYDARLDTRTGEVLLTMFGAVKQNTGEDWRDVALSLSTAQPQRGASLPNPGPRWVNIYKGRARKHSGRKQVYGSVTGSVPRAGDMFGGGESEDVPLDESVEETRKKANFVSAKIEGSNFASEFNIPGPADVLSDGTENKLMISDFRTRSNLEVHIRPNISHEAYLTARLQLEGDTTALPGQVSLFRDGAFIGHAQLPTLRPAESQLLYFGVDDKIAIRRNTTRDERRRIGLLSSEVALERHYVTTIQNLHKEAVDVYVKERIPVAKNESITVSLVEAGTTPGFERDAGTVKGLMVWKFKLDAKESNTVNLGWQVTWPSDHRLSGL